MPYKDPEVRRQKAREYARKRYRSDQEYRERVLKAQRERSTTRYRSDAEYRKRILAKKSERYHSDPAFKEDMKRRARESHARKMELRITEREGRLARQGGLCLLCTRPLALDEAHEDHDHRCCPGQRGCKKCVRGLLHGNCNVMIGMANDDPEVLRLGADYVERCHSSSKIDRA